MYYVDSFCFVFLMEGLKRHEENKRLSTTRKGPSVGKVSVQFDNNSTEQNISEAARTVNINIYMSGRHVAHV